MVENFSWPACRKRCAQFSKSRGSIRSSRFFRIRKLRWRGLDSGRRGEPDFRRRAETVFFLRFSSRREPKKTRGKFAMARYHRQHARRVSYPDAMPARTASVFSMFFEISNCAARWMFVGLAAARRDGSDQKRIASRKAGKSPGGSTIDPCTPFSIISLKPFERVVITGKPQASASRQALENGS